MKKFFAFLIFIATVGFVIYYPTFFQPTANGAPPYDASGTDNVSENEEQSLVQNWKRLDGPAKVTLQVGHWKNNEVPEELHRLRRNTGASGGGNSEWEVNYAIAEAAAGLLREKGVTVELLPATIPPQYWADVFVSIHADGSEDSAKTGYKVAAPRRDYTNGAEELVSSLENSYETATGLVRDPNVTRNMRGYYAFSWWRYDHSVHPMTTSAIVETGFLTNPADRRLIVNQPERSAEGIANGILQYL